MATGSIAADLRMSVRQLVKSPAFTIASVVVLSLGIGLNAAMFSLVYAFGFMGRPYAEPDRVVQLYSSQTKKIDSYRAFSYAAYRELADQRDIFSGLLAHAPALIGVSEGGISRRTFAVLASRNYFEVLGVPVIQGRGFTEEEDRAGQDIPVTVATYAYWQRTGFKPDLVGTTIRVNERAYTVIGITPRGFTGTMMVAGPELFFPLGVFHSLSDDFEGESDRSLQRAGTFNLFLVARLEEGVTIEAAAARLDGVGPQLTRAFPVEYEDARISLAPLGAARRHQRARRWACRGGRVERFRRSSHTPPAGAASRSSTRRWQSACGPTTVPSASAWSWWSVSGLIASGP